MKKIFLLLAVFTVTLVIANAQQLTVEKIMRDPKWIGTSPSNISWSYDSKSIFFYWNPDNVAADSLYTITLNDFNPKKTDRRQLQDEIPANSVVSGNGSSVVFIRYGDIWMYNKKTNTTRRITRTISNELNPVFGFNDEKIVYTTDLNLFAWDIKTGTITQLTNFQRGTAPRGETREILSPQEAWLKKDQLQLMEVLQERKKKREETDSANKKLVRTPELKTIYIDDKFLSTTISNDGRYITYRLYKSPVSSKNTIVPNYITESGFTTDIIGRSKVGTTPGTYELFVYDARKDSSYPVKTDELPGINDLPDYAASRLPDSSKKTGSRRNIIFYTPEWNAAGSRALIEIRSSDNKDRWLALLDPSSGKLKVVERQRDEAWVGGPSTQDAGWVSDHVCWFLSESTGYSHLYTMNVESAVRTSITSGKYEVQQAQLSHDKKYFFLTTNEVHPGEQHFYRITLKNNIKEKITNLKGASEVIISPDEKNIAIRNSYSNKPWELFIQENKPGTVAKQVTFKAASAEFLQYPWRDPEVITFAARDGAQVYARIYQPSTPHPSRPAVIFVHGAGYLQNAHKWWSSYFREYMFHNLLADNGYIVLDIDYRGSAGYGRDWRTGIYRHMGGKDLLDHIDGAKLLVEKYNVD
ncbi:MAG TPA: DPP IV N-terminal domain-containing protein, partial [Flavitalea sp.]|nr:DPP IV N-terminal domain-containing protein [Flavitalea sp.]